MQLAYHKFTDLSSVRKAFTAVAKSLDDMRRAMPSSDFATAVAASVLDENEKGEGYDLARKLRKTEFMYCQKAAIVL